MGGAVSYAPQHFKQPAVEVHRVSASSDISIINRYSSATSLEQDFLLGEALGYWPSGPVRCATNRADGREYAVKSMRKSGLSRMMREAMQKEIELSLTSAHPHIAKLHMIYETSELMHLVMEPLQGGQLYDRLLEAKAFPEETAADSVYQMLLALSYLHAQNIAHSDLKLESGVYESSATNRLKLVDFGFAKFWDGSVAPQACGSLYGRPVHYAAPGLLRECYTVQADMWSLGILTYMILTGEPAFLGTEGEILRRIKAGQPHYAKRFWELSWPAQSFVQSLLVKDPRCRMTAEEALDHPWVRGRRLRQRARPDDEPLDSPWASAQPPPQLCQAPRCMMAWTLSTEEQAKLREQFLSMDTGKRGTVKLRDLKSVLEETFHVENAEADNLFNSIDSDENQEIEYSEFLAAAVEGRVRVHCSALQGAFQALDAERNGKISTGELESHLVINNHDIGMVPRESNMSGSSLSSS